MTWLRLDVGFWDDPRVMSLSAEERDLYLMALAYTVRNLTDGAIPERFVRVVPGDKRARTRQAATLVASGLWHRMPDGWSFPPETWRRYQRTKDQVEHRRKRDRDRKRPQDPDPDSAVESAVESAADSAWNPRATSPKESNYQRGGQLEPIANPEESSYHPLSMAPWERGRADR